MRIIDQPGPVIFEIAPMPCAQTAPKPADRRDNLTAPRVERREYWSIEHGTSTVLHSWI